MFNFFSFNKVKISVIDFNDISNNEEFIDELRKLTICRISGMNQELDSLQDLADQKSVNAKVILAKRNNINIGWALLSSEKSNFHFMSGMEYNPKNGILLEIFVHPLHRKKGVGTLLVSKVKELVGSQSFCVSPFDIAGCALFDNHLKNQHIKI